MKMSTMQNGGFQNKVTSNARYEDSNALLRTYSAFSHMAYTVPLLNSIIFHVFSCISILLSAVTCYIYMARSREDAKSSQKLAYLLSPRQNPFFNHILLLASCSAYQVIRIVYFNVLPQLQGQPYHTVQGFANACFTAATIVSAAIIVSFTGMMLGLFVNLQWQQSRMGKRIINVAQVILTSELIVAIIVQVALTVTINTDYLRHYAWESAIVALMILSSGLVVVPIIFFTLRLIIISPPKVRSPLLKLLVSAVFGSGVALLSLLKSWRELNSYGFATLFTHRDPNYPPYQEVVADVLPLLDITVITFMHPFLGTFCSLPFLFSASTAKWLEDHASISLFASVSRIVNGSSHKSSQAPNSVSVAGPSFVMPS